MAGKVVVVTGGVGGIGRAICSELAAAGNRVIATYVEAEKSSGESWQAAQQALGHTIHLAPCDVTDATACEMILEQIAERHGAVDILVNCAGITQDGMFRKMDHSQWTQVIDTNLNSVYNMTRPLINGMIERGFGRIINIASVNGQKGQFGQTNYSAAKAGMHGFTMALAQETASKGITVNTVSPGYIGTAMVMAIAEEVRNKIVAQIPVGRLGQPEEIARVVAFLADEHNGFITGANIDINGGQWMH
ncbi:acetoacetyl-CoA reductase [Sedimenticola sp.]|uniref:acetoacetyl-CoA reductase n=1 Tax=Sedimenticola sp. TaxID=1940285 RepID=UPI003D12BE65